MDETKKPPLVLFDGLCNLCNSAVNFIIDRDPRARLTFAPLQSPTGQAALKQFGLAANALGSLIFVENSRCFVRSSAALRIARYLSGPWRLASAFLLVPRPLRDVVYDWIARNRYRWFGRRDSCRMPNPEIAGRFVDGDFAAKGELKTGRSEQYSK